MNTIQPLPTVYAGHHFRSRTEARWAVFFDKLGIRYEYEKEGYALPSGNYMPDFYLPEFRFQGYLGAWFEVKGQDPSDRECRLGKELSIATARGCLIASGAPSYSPVDGYIRMASQIMISETHTFFTRGQKLTAYSFYFEYLGQEQYTEDYKLACFRKAIDAIDASRYARFGT